jgi:hypothetical protein
LFLTKADRIRFDLPGFSLIGRDGALRRPRPSEVEVAMAPDAPSHDFFINHQRFLVGFGRIWSDLL